MFDIVDVVAVREAVERQTPVRRLICTWLMGNTPREDIEEMLGLSRWALRRHLLAIRRSFVDMGFVPPRQRGNRPRGTAAPSCAGAEHAECGALPCEAAERGAGTSVAASHSPLPVVNMGVSVVRAIG